MTAGIESESESSAVIDILLVEDNEADIQLMVEILKEGKIPNDFHVVTDGEAALAYVRNQPPYEKATTPGIVFPCESRRGISVSTTVKCNTIADGWFKASW